MAICQSPPHTAPNEQVHQACRVVLSWMPICTEFMSLRLPNSCSNSTLFSWLPNRTAYVRYTDTEMHESQLWLSCIPEKKKREKETTVKTVKMQLCRRHETVVSMVPNPHSRLLKWHTLTMTCWKNRRSSSSRGLPRKQDQQGLSNTEWR